MDIAVPAKSDCNLLLQAAMPFARQMLELEGGFLPFGAQMQSNGEIVSVGADNGEEYPHVPDLIDLLRDSFVAGAADGSLKATALVFDVTVTLPDNDRKSPAIAVALDHRDSYSVKVFFTYRIADGKASVGKAFAVDGDHVIFRRSVH